MRSDPEQSPTRHVIPQHYLKAFRDPTKPRHVWVYTKGRPYSTGNEVHRRNPFCQAIKRAAASRDVYKLITLTGEFLDVDPIISKQETLGLHVLRKLWAREPITLEDKAWFGVYIDLMHDRVPARDNMARPHVRKAMDAMPIEMLARKAAEEGRFDLARRLDRRLRESMELIEKELLLKGLVVRSAAIVKQIVMMRWTFFTADGDRFFPTTDNPAFFSPNPGLKNEHGFVLMPIDSQMILFISNGPWSDPQYAPITEENYNMFRNVILSSATEKAYACRHDPEILAIMEKPQLPSPAPKK
jgi:hypothetical protein